MLEEINDIKFITDPGISIEIKDFFSSQIDVSISDISIHNDEYHITVHLECFDFFKIKGMFMSFVSFIQYSYITIYKRDGVNGDGVINYELITADKKLRGFHCYLYFK